MQNRSAVGTRALVGLVCLAGAAGCSSDPPTPPPPKGDGGATTLAWNAAVGAGGLFAQTFDSLTWTTRSVGTANLYAVTCVGNSLGWAAGANGACGRTQDGGQTWTWEETGTTANLRAIRFGSATVGVAAGDGGTLLVTHDGGSTWSAIASPTQTTLRGAALTQDATVMLVVGDKGTVLRSTNGGSSFSLASIAGAPDLYAIECDPAARLVVAVDAQGGVWESVDAGASFVRAWTAPTPLGGVDVGDDGASALVAGANGTLAERSTAGQWQPVLSGTTADLHAALITTSASGALHSAGGESGTLVSSTDQGATWTAVPLGTAAALYGLEDL
jgi:photosystem II stability/assembly factor-like uncharacterized protein